MVPRVLVIVMSWVFCCWSQQTTSSIDSCSYTFHVPKQSNTEVCAPREDLESRIAMIEALIRNQQSQLELHGELLRTAVTSSTTSSATPSGGNGASNSVGTTYIRWGRTECPDTAQLVYHGYAGKANYDNGGGVDYQCLPQDVEWPEDATAGFQTDSYMYGVEYEDDSPLWPSSTSDNDVPCVLCNVSGRSRQVMIPAKQTCPVGWTREYYGILVSQRYKQKGSTFVCLNAEQESLSGGSEDNDGGLFYVVEAVCGSLKCPPYVNGYELSCVVCTL